MKRLRKYCTGLFAGVLMLLQCTPFVMATSVPDTSSIDALRIIAINALKDFPETETWTDVSILKETPLETLDGTVYAYCFDLLNSSDGQSAYIILSINNKEFPVIQFAPNATSAYYNMDESVDAVYLGPGAYYFENATHLTSLTDPEVQVAKEDIVAQISESEPEDTISRVNYSDIRTSYLNAERTIYPRYVCNLTDVPNYQWTGGCVPTSLSMILHYHWPNINRSYTTTVDELASYMLTTGSGNTMYYLVRNGVVSVLNNHDLSWHKAEYATTNSLGYPQFGAANNTLVEYKAELDSGYPVFIAMLNAPGTSPAYSEGFGDHAVVGVGYSFSGTFDYIIVHTTATSDGDIYVTPNSSDLGDFAWFYIHP